MKPLVILIAYENDISNSSLDAQFLLSKRVIQALAWSPVFETVEVSVFLCYPALHSLIFELTCASLRSLGVLPASV